MCFWDLSLLLSQHPPIEREQLHVLYPRFIPVSLLDNLSLEL
jgi:hypothetical protein